MNLSTNTNNATMQGMNTEEFNTILSAFYEKNKRNLPWREQINPYHVFITEVMLQQTQVPRVLIKFPEFISIFPTFESLADASMTEVLQVWQGMGYNRRGKYLKESAEIIMAKHKGEVPVNPDIVDEFPGIGYATARSIVTFIYNKPEIFIETNIRRVFIHHFFADSAEVADSEILPLIEKTINRKNPREWYYSLMDYGTFLSKTVPNPNRKSKHYTKQSKFEGSRRQIRGQVIKELLKGERRGEVLAKELSFDKNTVYEVLENLKTEGMIAEKNGIYSIK